VEHEVQGGHGHEEPVGSLPATFERKLPGSKDGPYDLNTEDGKDHQKAVLKNQKVMMQFALSITNVSLLNKINCKE
jgi:hypothetical protein